MSAGVAEIAICNALLCIDNSAYISTGNLKDTEVPFLFYGTAPVIVKIYTSANIY